MRSPRVEADRRITAVLDQDEEGAEALANGEMLHWPCQGAARVPVVDGPVAGASCPARSPVVSASAYLRRDGRRPNASRHASGGEDVMGIPTTLGERPVPRRPTPRLWLALLAVLAAAGPAAPAERFPLPPVAEVERGAYRARDLQTGRALWEGDWLLSRETRAGRTMLDLHENGKGIRDSPVATEWTERMRLDLWGPHPALTASREVRDADGVLVHRGQREFDFARGSGQQVREDVQTGTTTVRAVPLTAQAIPTELLSALLRLLPAARDQEMQFDLVTGEGRLVGMRARVVGRERVTVPAGTFDSFKVQLQPTGFLAFLATLDSKLYMWHRVAAPHVWVKYQGPDGSPGLRPVVRELVRFDTQRTTAPRPPAVPLATLTEGRAASVAPLARPDEPQRATIAGPPAVPIRILTEGLAAASVFPVARPDGRWSALPESLGYLLVLVALVFVLGVECGATVFPALRVRESQAKDEGSTAGGPDR